MKQPVETLAELRKRWESDASSGRHGYQNAFYAKILFDTFERVYPDFMSVEITEQFQILANACLYDLRAQYGYEYDDAKKDQSKNPHFLLFMEQLKDAGLIYQNPAKEIENAAPCIAQAYRTNNQHVFFETLKKDFFLTEISHQLAPLLGKEEAAARMKKEIHFAGKKVELVRPFQYKKQDIALDSDGTHVNINPSPAFKAWLFDNKHHQEGTPVFYSNGWCIFKKDENTIFFNKGPGSAGVLITVQEKNLLVRNTRTADSSVPEGRTNLESTLSELYQLPGSGAKRCRSPLPAPVVEPKPDPVEPKADPDDETDCRIM